MAPLIIFQMIQVQRDVLYKKWYQQGHQLTTMAEKMPKLQASSTKPESTSKVWSDSQ